VTTVVETFRGVIVAASTSVADRVSPLRAAQDQSFPYAILSEVSAEPLNVLAGYEGTDHSEVQVDAWGATYLEADTAARQCRTALEAAGYICSRKIGDEPDSQIEPNPYRVGFVFDVWH